MFIVHAFFAFLTFVVATAQIVEYFFALFIGVLPTFSSVFVQPRSQDLLEQKPLVLTWWCVLCVSAVLTLCLALCPLC